jgi:6-phosphogluconolactonase/glucosamine-6-phosphate isomerase/deaminase
VIASTLSRASARSAFSVEAVARYRDVWSPDDVWPPDDVVDGGVAAANWVPQLDQWRFTLTFPAINNARNVMFMVAGAEKASALKEVLEGRAETEPLPARSVQPADGELFWFVDKDAAGQLSG